MLKIKNVAIVTTLAILMLFANTSCQYEESATGDVSGNVKVQDGRPVPSADTSSDSTDDSQESGDEESDSGDEDDSGSGSGSGTGTDSGPGSDSGSGSGTDSGSGSDSGSDSGSGTDSGDAEYAEVVYTVVYDNKNIITIAEGAISSMAEVLSLEEDTDYTIDKSTKTITLTKSGYKKYTSFSGADSGDAEYAISSMVEEFCLDEITE